MMILFRQIKKIYTIAIKTQMNNEASQKRLHIRRFANN